MENLSLDYTQKIIIFNDKKSINKLSILIK